MRNLDGTLNGDLGDNKSATFSGSLVNYVKSTIDENETIYSLLPDKINNPPIIVGSIEESSTPKILSYQLANGSSNNMHTSPAGTVKVSMGVNITLAIQAAQSDIPNVENGVLTIIPPTQDLSYRWRKDNIYISDSDIPSLQSSLVLMGNKIIITNIQPSHGGVYTCEVSNDIGSVNSEEINIEVYNFDNDSFFYRNLILNPYGKDGINSWNANNGDFKTAALHVGKKIDLYKPNRVDIFGYTTDMMVPRPYQVDPGILKDIDLYKELSAPGDVYFTRSNYKYEKRGGNWLVKAYQDIDVTALQEVIKGGIYGIEGIRAFFSCYIGSALSNYNPTPTTQLPNTRTKESSYDLANARVSLSNFKKAGPCRGLDEKTTVTVEEYNGETRLASTVAFKEASEKYTGGGELVTTQDNRNYIGHYHIHPDKGYMAGARHTPANHDYLSPVNGFGTQLESITLQDPWSKRVNKYIGQNYPGSNSGASPIDTILLTADELWDSRGNVGSIQPSQARLARPTYGQFIEFNKVILERLHQDTTKIRITITFEYESSKWSETFQPFIDSSEEIYEVSSWSFTYGDDLAPSPNPSNATIYNNIKGSAINIGKETQEFMLKAGVPRGMVTALNLSLTPIYKYDASRTNNDTNTTLVKNNTPEGILANGLA